jgi:hypothetical protein
MRSPYLYLFSVLTVAGLLAAPKFAQAAQGSPNRDPRVCQGGQNVGQSCTDDTQCPQSTCEPNFVRGLGSVFFAELTLIVDDDVSKYDGTEQVSDVIAVTVLLETYAKGKKYHLAQTYQKLEGSDFAALVTALQAGPIIADTDRSRGEVNESKLNDALDPSFIGTDPTKSLLDDVFLQAPDNPMADELRRIFGVVGRPIVVDTVRRLGFVEHSDYEANGLASVVRLWVKFRFLQEP